MPIMDCMSSLTRLHYVSKMPALQACVASDVLCHVPKERYAACVYPLATCRLSFPVWKSAGDDMLVPSVPKKPSVCFVQCIHRLLASRLYMQLSQQI